MRNVVYFNPTINDTSLILNNKIYGISLHAITTDPVYMRLLIYV